MLHNAHHNYFLLRSPVHTPAYSGVGNLGFVVCSFQNVDFAFVGVVFKTDKNGQLQSWCTDLVLELSTFVSFYYKDDNSK